MRLVRVSVLSLLFALLCLVLSVSPTSAKCGGRKPTCCSSCVDQNTGDTCDCGSYNDCKCVSKHAGSCSTCQPDCGDDYVLNEGDCLECGTPYDAGCGEMGCSYMMARCDECDCWCVARAACSCGNGVCDGVETCKTCPADCGKCEPSCGDGVCNGSETPSNCPNDCPVVCGDGRCDGKETCSNCSRDCGSCCTATAPTNLSVTALTLSSARITWTPGANGTKQILYGGANKSEVDAGCPGISSPTCVVKAENLLTSVTSYETGSVLATGTVYYWRVVNYQGASCSTTSSTKVSVSSCALVPNILSLEERETATITASVNSSSQIQRVAFSENSQSITLNPESDATYVYQSVVTAHSLTEGVPATVTAEVIEVGSNSVLCTSIVLVSVVSPGPWWQVVDSDILTNGDLVSHLPNGMRFDLPGSGNYPGVPAYGGTTNLTTSNVSTKGWLANSLSSNPSGRVYNYDYFVSQIPDGVTFKSIDQSSIPGSYFSSEGTKDENDYYWFKYDGTTRGDLTIDSAVSLGGRKVILLVDSANLYIKGRIDVTDGSGFFMALVGKSDAGEKGSIVVDPAVGGNGLAGDLEGYFLADGTFSTGTNGEVSDDIQLYVKGSVAALSGFSLQRDLGDASNRNTPAEVFEYTPYDYFLFPLNLGTRKMRWKEVAP